MAENDMIQGVVEFYDDFTSPFSSATNGQIASKCVYTVGNSATVTRLGINGGAARLTITATETDVASVFGPIAFEPDECGLGSFQVRVRSSDVSVSSIFIGMTDIDTDTVVIEDEDGTIQTVATDAFGILLEGEQDGTWQTMGVGNDVDDTQAAFNIGDDPADSEWHTYRIEFHNRNAAGAAGTVVRYRVYIDGLLMTTAATDALGWVTSAARSSIIYCPVVSADARNAAYTVDVAEMVCRGGVGTVFD